MKNRLTLTLLAALASVAASAGGNWRLDSSYDFTFTGAVGAFHDLETIMGGPSVGDTYGWGSSTGYYGGSPTSHFDMSFDTTPFNEFLGGSPSEPILQESFAMGIMDALPTDAPGQQHLVLFMNPTAAGRVQHIAYGTIFGTSAQPFQYTEETIIDAIQKLHSNLTEEQQAPYRTIFENFRDKVARSANVGPSGLTDTCWFAPSEGFSIVTFSDGLTIGAGSNTFGTTFTPVPEPASFVALGVGALALLRRLRR